MLIEIENIYVISYFLLVMKCEQMDVLQSSTPPPHLTPQTPLLKADGCASGESADQALKSFFCSAFSF
jgi:hypothetical protein